MERIKEYLPSIGMAIAAVLSVFVASTSDNRLTSDEIGNLLLAALGAVLVYIVPRLPGAKWLKPAVGATTAALQAALSMWVDGITANEWAQIILTALGFLGILATNKQVPLYTTRAARYPG